MGTCWEVLSEEEEEGMGKEVGNGGGEGREEGEASSERREGGREEGWGGRKS